MKLSKMRVGRLRSQTDEASRREGEGGSQPASELLQRIEDEALDGDVVKALLLCQKLGGRTGSVALRSWAKKELNGWPGDEPAPDYRMLTGAPIGHGSAPGRTVRMALSPDWFPPELVADILAVHERSSISEIQRTSEKEHVSIVPNIASTLAQHVTDKNAGSVQFHRVDLSLPGSAYTGIVTAARSKLVEFVAELQNSIPPRASVSDTKVTKAVTETTRNVILSVSGEHNTVTVGDQNETAVDSRRWSFGRREIAAKAPARSQLESPSLKYCDVKNSGLSEGDCLIKKRNMTVPSSPQAPDFDSLNQMFYQEHGPGEFILMRLYNLGVVGGSFEKFKDILAGGIDYADCQVLPTITEDDDAEGTLKQSEEAFQQHFLRIETHHLKHLAIETLLRMFLGHKRYPLCPWLKMSSFTNFREFKKTVDADIVEAGRDVLQSEVLDVLLGRSGDLNSATDSDLDVSDNLARLLRVFSSGWLDEAKSYNATKHGLTAVPGAADVKVGVEGEEMMPVGFGDSLTHLTYGPWKDNERTWSVTTRWIHPEQAVATILLAAEMLMSLWSVARCRYGLSETYGTFRLSGSVFSIENLREMGTGSALEMSRTVFPQRRHPSSG